MIINLELAKQHLRVDSDDADEIIVTKIAQAERIVMQHIKGDEASYDPDETSSGPLPPDLEAAILLVVEALFDGEEPLSGTVRALLTPHRDPTIA